jgi:selT/selW/selH-like putative selenoprotein
VSLAAAIKDAFDAETTLKIGTPGQFDIVVDGKLVFSKQAEGRFPEHQEVLEGMSKLTR